VLHHHDRSKVAGEGVGVSSLQLMSWMLTQEQVFLTVDLIAWTQHSTVVKAFGNTQALLLQLKKIYFH
jgi:hypothetical protein